ncbi:MAG TPA: DUF6754 domain-containing protein [Candidatus Udaeobacter sp.]|nr:DUF6754 domain-containing protein [Candidatus Udaeobacter sp.]
MLRAVIALGLVWVLGAGLARAESPETTAPASTPATEPLASPLAPPANVAAQDEPDDNGHGYRATWTLSPDDAQLLAYEVWMAPSAESPSWALAGSAPHGTTTFSHTNEEPTAEGQPNPVFVPIGKPIYIKVRGRTADGAVTAFSPVVSATPQGNWYHRGKTNVLIATLLFAAATVYFIRSARSGKPLYIRPIAGISAVDEAIGRATEMGRPILFVLGTGTAGDIATIAGYTILARVARRTAEYQTPILVPVNDPVMMAMAQETVREAYLEAGRPDLYRPENVFYISAMQFPYVAAVNGLMLREKTATNFYMGVFHAESLLLAEAGSTSGSIQISGTDQVSQIPFFVAATDYTLIGEELYAASAYLSQDPVLMGPLKAQDLAKVVILIILAAGVLAWTFFGTSWFAKLVHAV